MSGHSKWSNIQHKKGKNDKARAAIFTKLCKAITVAASEGGGDADMNFSLRLAIDKAKSENVPKDNILRAVKRGTGEDKDGVVFEHALYEGFGPGGVALLIECLTDNTNRTVSEVKLILSKKGGSAAGQGSVQWQFEQKGIIRFSTEKKATIADWEEAQLGLMDAGMLDIYEIEDGCELSCSRENLQKLVEAVLRLGVEPDHSALEWVAKDTIELSDEDGEQLGRMLDAFEENDDVKEVYTNAA